MIIVLFAKSQVSHHSAIVKKSSPKLSNIDEESSFYAETNIFSDQIVPGWIDFDDGMDLRMHHLLGALGSGPLSP